MRLSPLRSVAASLAVVAVLTGTLTGCATRAVPMQPAVDANNPACADVIVRLPDTLGELDRRNTDAQSTGAWGDPAAVLLYCGIEPSGPTTDECMNVNGVDWIRDDSNEPLFRFEAYGREPGLEVIIDARLTSGTSIITELTAVVSQLPQTRECTGVADTFDLGGTSEVPSEPSSEPAA